MMIEEGPSSNQGSSMGPNSGYGMNSKQNFDDHTARMEYNMPGILHFLQTEWAKFEMERAQWDVEKAELQARIAFLQGERKGQENLKQDLVRRIKMLEFALRQERAKYQKLQYGVEQTKQQQSAATSAANNGVQSSEDEFEDNAQANPTTGPTYRQGRQLLKQYLEEIGYTDALLDVRSSRVRSLLGIHTDRGEQMKEEITQQNNQSGMSDSRLIITAPPIAADTSSMINNDADDVMKVQLNYLPQTSGTVVDDADDSDEDDSFDEVEDEDDDDDLEERRRIANSLPSGGSNRAASPEPADEMEEEEALAEFDFLVSEQGGDDGRTDGDGSEWTKHTDWPLDKQKLSMQIEQYKKERIRKHDNAQRPRKTDLQAMIATLGAEEDDVADTEDRGDSPKASNEMMMRFPPGSSMERHLDSSALGLGDLADITVSNDETDSLTLSFDLNAADNNARKTWNAKYTLRSHFDGVRALVFHPVEPVLLTASEDHTMKLWNLQKTVPTKKATALDVEPVYTFRAHQGPVLCVAMSATGEECYSGGMDSTIRCWNLPSSNIDPYDSYDSSILQDTLVAHTDAVWGIAIHSTRVQLLSCSADSTVRLWTPGQQKLALNNTFLPPTEGDGVPTCIDFLANDPNRMMVAYSSGNCYVFDLSTGQHVVKFDSPAPDTNPRINKILSHPTLPVAISAHEDRSIKFYDTTNGELMHSMVAHLDAVTSLAIDPNGLYLLSGSHDNSIRLWSMESKTCVQEITSHRKKLDESVFDVAFHPSKPYIASAGADGVAKVLV